MPYTPGYYDSNTGQFYPATPQQSNMQTGNAAFSPYGNPSQWQTPMQQPPQYAASEHRQPQPQSHPSLPGRTVDDIKEVKPAEIPMDGTWCFFPLRNGTKVYVKLWDDSGELRTFSFIPEEPIREGQKAEEQSKFDKILTRLDDLEAAVLGRTASKKKEEK